ncbi:MAG TPA: TRAM domain-containing protein, partial [Bacteroidia bacterium]
KISKELNKKMIGKTFKVLFDKVEGDHFVGRTEFDSPDVDNLVLVDMKKNYARIGDFANVKIISAESYDLTGEII